MGTNDLSLGPAACPFLIPGRRSKHFDMDGKLSVSLNTITLAASETRESVATEIKLTTNSSYLTGDNITYSGGRGSSALKIGVTYSGLGGVHGIYVKLDTSGVQVTGGHGVVGIKCVVVNTAALTDGEIYGAMFIAKHNHATNIMTAQASLIGLEAWAYISDAGPARTVIGGNFAIHNECTGTPGAGSVHRVVQIVCDNASGAVVAEESTGICIWNMAGAWNYAIKIATSSTGFATGLQIDTATKAINIDACGQALDADSIPASGSSNATIHITTTVTTGLSVANQKALYIETNCTGTGTVTSMHLGIHLETYVESGVTITAEHIGIYVATYDDRAGNQNTYSLRLEHNGAGVAMAFIEFVSAASKMQYLFDFAQERDYVGKTGTPGSQGGFIKVRVAGTDKWIMLYGAAS